MRPSTPAGWPAGIAIWSLLVHPKDPNLLFVGTCPSALYRSRDGGETWEKLNAALTPECPTILFSRVTCIRADPNRPQTVWAGVEIDCVWRSDDAGETWRRLAEGLSSADIHDLAILPGQPGTVFASTNNDVNVSRDDGASWQPLQVKSVFPFAYCRGLTLKADDPNTLLWQRQRPSGNGRRAANLARRRPDLAAGRSLRRSPTARSGRLRRTAQPPTFCSAPPSTARSIAARTARRPGANAPREFGEVRCLALVVP